MICDSEGIPFFSRTFNEFQILDDALLSGLISAIGSIGKTLFKKDIAMISYGGENQDDPRIIIVPKDLFNEEKSIFFVYLVTGVPELKKLREISTLVFVESKNSLKMIMSDRRALAEKINKILDSRYPNLGKI